MRMKPFLLCTAVVLLIVLSTVLVLLCRKDSRDGYQTPFATNAQANIVSCGDFLYFCDVRQNKALCSYNLKTQKTQLLLEKTGELKQTTTAIYYIAGQELYRITGTSLQKIYSIPSLNFEFIDIVNGSVYWISYDSIEAAENDTPPASGYTLCRINPSDMVLPETLWEQNKTRIRDAVYYQERIYILTDQGVYCTHPDRKETEKISDFEADCFIYNDAFLLFKLVSDNSVHGYHEITADLQTLQKSTVAGSVATVYNETLYYPSAETLWSVDLSIEEPNRTMEKQLPGYPWSAIHATAPGVFLREYMTANIWFYEFETGNFDCIIPQQQTE